LLKGISTDISPVGSGIQPSNLSVNGPTLLTLPPASLFLSIPPSLPLSQASDVIEDLEQTVAQLRQQLQDSEHRRLKQLRVNCVCVRVRERENCFIPQLEEVEKTIQMCVQRPITLKILCWIDFQADGCFV
jgi:hypothetical protein